MRLDALRAFAIAVLAFGIVLWAGAGEPVGQAGLVVIGTLVSYMASIMLKAGFAPYPLEWWHWSYGDDVWASFVGSDALYDVVEDEGS